MQIGAFIILKLKIKWESIKLQERVMVNFAER